MGVSKLSRRPWRSRARGTAPQPASAASTHASSPRTLPMAAFRSSSSLHEFSNDTARHRRSRSVTCHCATSGWQVRRTGCRASASAGTARRWRRTRQTRPTCRRRPQTRPRTRRPSRLRRRRRAWPRRAPRGGRGAADARRDTSRADRRCPARTRPAPSATHARWPTPVARAASCSTAASGCRRTGRLVHGKPAGASTAAGGERERGGRGAGGEHARGRGSRRRAASASASEGRGKHGGWRGLQREGCAR